jgi:hypothetical protein
MPSFFEMPPPPVLGHVARLPRSPLVLPILVAGALAGCGGGETATETVTVTKTVVQAPAAPAPTTAAPAASGPAAPPTGLPAEQVALMGTFDMEVTDANVGGLNASGSATGAEEEWRLRTTCQGPDCEVELRRRLTSGGLEVIRVQPHPDRPDQWFGEFRSKGQCGGRENIPTDANITLRGLQAENQVATKLEAFWRAEDIACNDARGGVARYSGTLRPETADAGR